MSMESIETRLRRGDKCVNSIENAVEKNPRYVSEIFTIHRRLGGRSRFGEAHVISLKDSNDLFALKIIPMSSETDKIDWKEKEVVKEIKALINSRRIVENYVCPNLPLIFGIMNCENARYTNKNLIKRGAPMSCVMVFNELANGDLREWKKDLHSSDEWKSCMFQVLCGLSAIEETMLMMHGDMHYGNMLYTNIEEGGCWHYRFIEGENIYDYYPPNAGQVWKLWDFGCSEIKRHKREMWKDIHRGIYQFMIEEPEQSEMATGIKPSTLTWDERKKMKKDIYRVKKSKNFPAFALIKALSWFQKPTGKILNEIPYTIKIRAIE